jgi:hypothetical protein
MKKAATPAPRLRASARRVVRRSAWGEETATTRGRRWEGRQRHPPHDAPPTTATNNCSWGGKGCHVSGMGARGREGDGGEEGDQRATSTPHHRHEQLLVGWIRRVSARERRETGTEGTRGRRHPARRRQREHTQHDRMTPLAFARFFFVYFFCLKLVVTAPSLRGGGFKFNYFILPRIRARGSIKQYLS